MKEKDIRKACWNITFFSLKKGRKAVKVQVPNRTFIGSMLIPPRIRQNPTFQLYILISFDQFLWNFCRKIIKKHQRHCLITIPTLFIIKKRITYFLHFVIFSDLHSVTKKDCIKKTEFATIKKEGTKLYQSELINGASCNGSTKRNHIRFGAKKKNRLNVRIHLDSG